MQQQQPGGHSMQYIPHQGISQAASSNTLSFSMPATRMGTINADSNQTSNYILRHDMQDGSRGQLHVANQMGGLQDRRNTSPIAIQRVDQQPHIQNSGDPRSRQLGHQQMTAPNVAYQAPTILAQAAPLYLQPRPVIAQPLN